MERAGFGGGGAKFGSKTYNMAGVPRDVCNVYVCQVFGTEMQGRWPCEAVKENGYKVRTKQA